MLGISVSTLTNRVKGMCTRRTGNGIIARGGKISPGCVGCSARDGLGLSYSDFFYRRYFDQQPVAQFIFGGFQVIKSLQVNPKFRGGIGSPPQP